MCTSDHHNTPKLEIKTKPDLRLSQNMELHETTFWVGEKNVSGNALFYTEMP